MEKNTDNLIDFSRTIYEIKRKKYYYAVAFAVFLIIGILYYCRKNPVYLFHANMLIEQESGSSGNSGMMSMMKQFSLGSFSGGSVDDEILVVESRSLIKEMVKELKLNVTYIEKDGIKRISRYKTSPIEVLAPASVFDTLARGVIFKVKIRPDGNVDIKGVQGLFSTVYEAENLKLPTTVVIPTGGAFVFEKTPFFKNGEEMDMTILVSGYDPTAEDYQGRLDIDYTSKKSNGISLTLEDDNIRRGKDVLNKTFELYNRRRLGENNEKTESELKFIDDRLASLTVDLENAEKNLEKYKTENKITNLTAEAQVLLDQTSQSNAMIVQYQTQLSIFDMIVNFLENPANRYSLIPVTSGVENENAANSIEGYNNLILQRMKLDISAKDGNKVRQMLNQQIDAMRTGVIETIKKVRESAQISYDDYLKENGKYMGRLGRLPEYERIYVDLARNREIKNSLYMFLIEQRENSLLKIGSNNNAGRIIDVAYNDTKPIAPKASMILMVIIVMSALIPTLIFVYRTIFAKNIILKADIARFTDLPVAAEIHNPDNSRIDYSQQSEAATNMRSLRNRLLSKEAKVAIITSVFSDEGANAIAANLSELLALSSKRVAVVDISGNLKSETTDKSGNIEIIDPKVGNSQDALLSETFLKLISELKESHDSVIILGKALSEYNSLQYLSNTADRVLLVLHSGQKKKPYIQAFKECVSQIDNDKIDIILNFA